jgi:hypothetical protein
LASRETAREVVAKHVQILLALALIKSSSSFLQETTRADTELSEKDKGEELVIIAADITTETKVVFPKMGGLYWCEPEPVNPAYFARASMSIRFFFLPLTVNDCSPDRHLWKEPASYEGPRLDAPCSWTAASCPAQTTAQATTSSGGLRLI